MSSIWTSAFCGGGGVRGVMMVHQSKNNSILNVLNASVAEVPAKGAASVNEPRRPKTLSIFLANSVPRRPAYTLVLNQCHGRPRILIQKLGGKAFFFIFLHFSRSFKKHTQYTMSDVSTPTLLDAINQNNVGVAMMEAGNYRRSVRMLSRAIKQFRDVQVFKEDEVGQGKASQNDEKLLPIWTELRQVGLDESSSSISNDDDDDETDDDLASRNQSLLFDAASKNMNDDDIELDDVFLYRHPIEIPTTAINYPQVAQMTCTVICFNLALAHQLLAAVTSTTTIIGKDESKKSVSLLQKSQAFYELSLQMVRTQFGMDPTNFWFILAILNNLGFTHCQLQHHKGATDCFQFIMSVLVLIGEYDIRDFDTTLYFWNACAVLDEIRVAPAA